MAQRKVYFFKMNFRKTSIIKKNDESVAQQRYFDSSELKPFVDRMIGEFFTKVKKGKYAYALDYHTDLYVIETIDYDQNKPYIIFKIGHKKATNTVGIRNQKTLEIKRVPLEPNQNLEMFTYCYFDLKTQVCAIIQVYGAPTIAALRNVFSEFFKNYYSSENIYITASSILTENILDIIKGKEIISNITATVAIPEHTVLDKVVYVDRKSFGDFQNVKHADLTFSIVGKRSGNIFKSGNQLELLLEKLREKYGKDLKRFSVKAKNISEQMQEYNILDYCLTKSVNLSGENADSFTETDIINALKGVYNTSIEEITQYLR